MSSGFSSTYWCHRCDRFVTTRTTHFAICPDCGSGFVEEISTSGGGGDGEDTDIFHTSPLTPLSPRHLSHDHHHHNQRRRRHIFSASSSPSPPSPSPSSTTVTPGAGSSSPIAFPGGIDRVGTTGSRIRRMRRRIGRANDRSSFFNYNPVIVLRGGDDPGGGDGGGEFPASEMNVTELNHARNYQLYYDDGAGLGLRPLPVGISEFLMGSGFDRLLDQLSHLEINGGGAFGGGGGGTRVEHPPPASKSAVDSMPVVKITANHVTVESHCAVCKDAFEVNTEVREMPCKHIYHTDCIIPWLCLRNSCPVCRFELPTDGYIGSPMTGLVSPEEELGEVGATGTREESAGLTIWRLPGGGFAVGRFSGGRRGAERDLPTVYTEMDGRFSDTSGNGNGDGGGIPRRVTWTPNRSNVTSGGESRGFGRTIRGIFSYFRRRVRSSPGTRRTTTPPPPSMNSSNPSGLVGEFGGQRSRSHSIFRRRQSENWTFGV